MADDALNLWESAGRPLSLEDVCPQRFVQPIAPHLAARADQAQADFDLMIRGLEKWQGFDVVIVEGAGGLMSPVSNEMYSADLAHEFGYPTIIVAANRLGVINEALQTLITGTTFRDGLSIAGLVLNDVTASAADDPSHVDNLPELRLRCVPPILTHVRYGSTAAAFDSVNWMKLACDSTN